GKNQIQPELAIPGVTGGGKSRGMSSGIVVRRAFVTAQALLVNLRMVLSASPQRAFPTQTALPQAAWKQTRVRSRSGWFLASGDSAECCRDAFEAEQNSRQSFCTPNYQSKIDGRKTEVSCAHPPWSSMNRATSLT